MKAIRNVLACLILAIIAYAAVAQETPTSAGFLMVSGWYKDAGIQRQYTQAVGPVLKEHGYKGAVTGLLGSNLKVVEGDWLPGRMILLIEFPSAKDVKSFWWSEAYAKVKAIRATSSNLDVVQLDGVPGVIPAKTDKSAYLIFVGDVKDLPRFANEYGKYAPSVVEAHKGRFLVREGRAQMSLLEGSYPPGSVIVVEFPDTAALRSFWNSDEYKRLSEIRKSTGIWSVVEITPNAG